MTSGLLQAARSRALLRAGGITVASATALALRLASSGPDGAGSLGGGFVFAAALAAVCACFGTRMPAPRQRDVALGLAGAGLLCLPPLLIRLGRTGAVLPTDQFARWAPAVIAVAVLEEMVLRGCLFDTLAAWRGQRIALVVSTGVFAVLHGPLYGWGAMPLDLAAGILLGLLRIESGGWVAPAITHVLADLAGWVLR